MDDIRWQQRRDSFERAFGLLREVCERGVDTLTQLEQEGAIQRFEMTFELAWKTMRDLLIHEGVVLEQATPRSVIKEAAAAGLLADAELWIDMMLHRNRLSHTYDYPRLSGSAADGAGKIFPRHRAAANGFY